MSTARYEPLKKIMAICACAAFLLLYLPEAIVQGASNTVSSETLQQTGRQISAQSYREYISLLKESGSNSSGGTVKLTTAELDAAESKSAVAGSYEKSEIPSANISANGKAVWRFQIDKSGLVKIQIDYIVMSNHENSAEISVLIDGVMPYSELRAVELSRLWASGLKDGEFETDLAGNDLPPQRQELRQWQKVDLYDSIGHYNDPLCIYLTPGEHTLTIQMNKEALAVREILLSPPTIPKQYKDIAKSHQEMGYSLIDADAIILEGEKADMKSVYTIMPRNDQTSAATSPQSAKIKKLNTVAGNRWKLPGERLNWKLIVPKSGLYTISLRYKQNIQIGSFVSRRLFIDGKIPFQEAARLQFPYGDGWQTKILGEKGDTPYYFYLTAGEEHIITLETTLGSMAESINSLTQSLYSLNGIYRDILMVTGTTPDLYRDYEFPALIPESIDDMKNIKTELTRIYDNITKVTGATGEQTAIIQNLILQLERMSKAPNKIAANFLQFKDNIGALGALVQAMREQPLELDFIAVTGAAESFTGEKDRFLKNAWFQFQLFIASFTTDYRKIGETKKGDGSNNLRVWIATGRDQAQIIRTMIDDSFYQKYSTSVSLELVAGGTLLPATLSGIGPDISLSNGSGDPLNFALRNAVMDLSVFKDIKEVTGRFHESALIPLSFNGGLYGLPETQSFPMMFYRTDIFEELGLKVPDTWDDFYIMIPELQKNNMEVGFPTGFNGLQLFLYQNNEPLYRENGFYINLDSDVALSSFKTLCDLFTLYRLPVSYNFVNRFRTGEMPIAITDYTAYNQLTVFAPEIAGLWEFLPVPGILQEDGSVNRNVYSDVLAVMMQKETKNPDAAWNFMKWWTSAEVQKNFALDMESILGPSAKQPVANLEAFKKLSWSTAEYDAITAQWDKTVGIQQIPGGYMATRNVDFAFAKVYNEGSTPSETLLDYILSINKELLRKQSEFGLR